MRILNLYAGIGGNRKLWGDEHEITAVENNQEIANIYQSFFPKDKVIVADAHQFLLEHYKEFDFIWSSPPCPTHSKIRKFSAVARGQNEPVYPDLKLYEEILFLMGYFEGKWVVENVISWYDPLIKPFIFRQHYYWSNFVIDGKENASRCHNAGNEALQELKGFDLSRFKGIDKTKALRNCVEPEAGLFIFNSAFKEKQQSLIEVVRE
jgi:DNA (cytosine-5)-methyltransferase 1